MHRLEVNFFIVVTRVVQTLYNCLSFDQLNGQELNMFRKCLFVI